MGTRYTLTLNCPHCNTVNDDVYFAPTSGFGSHNCVSCKRKFWIDDDLSACKQSPEIDMRRYSMHGDKFEELTGAPNMQHLE